MKTNIKTAFLFCLALFSACSSDNDEPGAEQQPTQQPAQEKRYPLTIITQNLEHIAARKMKHIVLPMLRGNGRAIIIGPMMLWETTGMLLGTLIPMVPSILIMALPISASRTKRLPCIRRICWWLRKLTNIVTAGGICSSPSTMPVPPCASK